MPLALLLVLPSLSVDPTCSKGLVHDSTCCAAACGTCGLSGCSSRPGGASSCCDGPIKGSGRSCAHFDPPCEIGPSPPAPFPKNATLTLDVNKPIASVPPQFLSFTFDASQWRALDLDGRDDAQTGAYGATLDVLAAALGPAHLRVGGTQGDYDVYAGFGDGSVGCDALPAPMTPYRCKTVEPSQMSSLLGFTERNGLSLVFGLNDMYGRSTKTEPERDLCGAASGGHAANGAAGGGGCPPRNQSNAAALLRWLAAQPLRPGTLHGLEIGNELNSVLGGAKGAEAQAADLVALKALVESVWAASSSSSNNKAPVTIGPDTHSSAEFKQQGEAWFAAYAAAAGHAAAALTYHEYSLGNGPALDPSKLDGSFLSPAQLDRAAAGAASLQTALAKQPGGAPSAGWAPLWAGETAAANDGGQSGITDTFVDVFWYLDALGSLAAKNVSVFLRQTLLFKGGYPLVELSETKAKDAKDEATTTVRGAPSASMVASMVEPSSKAAAAAVVAPFRKTGKSLSDDEPSSEQRQEASSSVESRTATTTTTITTPAVAAATTPRGAGDVAAAVVTPLPDYWLALLHKRLMGPVVLNASSGAADVRLYAHCGVPTRTAAGVTQANGVVVAFANLASFAVSLAAPPLAAAAAAAATTAANAAAADDAATDDNTTTVAAATAGDAAAAAMASVFSADRDEYFLTAGAPIDGASSPLQSKRVILNGANEPLALLPGGGAAGAGAGAGHAGSVGGRDSLRGDPPPRLPELPPRKIAGGDGTPVVLPPHSVGFVHFFPATPLPACSAADVDVATTTTTAAAAAAAVPAAARAPSAAAAVSFDVGNMSLTLTPTTQTVGSLTVAAADLPSGRFDFAPDMATWRGSHRLGDVTMRVRLAPSASASASAPAASSASASASASAPSASSSAAAAAAVAGGKRGGSKAKTTAAAAAATSTAAAAASAAATAATAATDDATDGGDYVTLTTGGALAAKAAPLPTPPGELAAANLTGTLATPAGSGLSLALSRHYSAAEGGQGVSMRFELVNTGGAAVEVGAWGAAMVFDTMATLGGGRSLDDYAGNCSMVDPAICGEGGWVSVTRMTGGGGVLMVVPEGATGFEAWRTMREATNSPDELTSLAKAWADNEWSGARGEQWVPPTSLTLAPGEAANLSYRLLLAPDLRSKDAALARAGFAVVQVLPPLTPPLLRVLPPLPVGAHAPPRHLSRCGGAGRAGLDHRHRHAQRHAARHPTARHHHLFGRRDAARAALRRHRRSHRQERRVVGGADDGAAARPRARRRRLQRRHDARFERHRAAAAERAARAVRHLLGGGGVVRPHGSDSPSWPRHSWPPEAHEAASERA